MLTNDYFDRQMSREVQEARQREAAQARLVRIARALRPKRSAR